MPLLAALLAEDPPPANPLGRPEFFLVAMMLFFFVFFFLPQRRQRKEQEAMLASLKPGAKVVTAAGLIGTIIKLKDGEDEVTLRSDDTKLRVTRSSIARVLGMEEETKS